MSLSTIVDVANAAGVSISTASRALRGLNRVSPATRAKVEDAARRLRYVASPTGSALASGQTRVIALVTPFITRGYFAAAVSAIEKQLRGHGYQAMLFDLEEASFERRMTLSESMLWKRVDGVIILNVPLSEEEQALLDRLGLPIVSLGTVLNGEPCVRIDDAAAMRTAIEHLVTLGHLDIAYVGDVGLDAALTETPHARLDAFRETLRSHGLTPNEDWVLRSDWTAASGQKAAHRLFNASPQPTAVAAGDDDIAIGVLIGARQLGLRVPEDVSVIGIDDHEFSELLGLSTVRQDVVALGATAARMLLDLLSGGPTTAVSDDIVLPTELVLRESTALRR